MKKIAVVGLPGGWSSETLADQLGQATGFRLLVDMSQVTLDLASGRAWFGEVELNQLDGLIIKKLGPSYSPDLLDRLEVLRFLHQRGLAMFSPPESIMRVLDRLSCTVTLSLAGIPLPATVITEDLDQALAQVERLGAVVLKPLYSTKARGMCLVRAGSGAKEQLAQFKAAGNQTIYMQQKVELPGRDLGVVFLGGRYLATYARAKQNDSWNTTTRSGGRYEAHEPSPEVVELATRAQAPFNLDFTCVDVAETDQGLIVFEVSAFGGFRGLAKANGLDAARLYASYVLEKL